MNACPFGDDKKKIVLYYVGDVAVADLLRFLKENLPRYMVPNVTEQLDALPYTPNGKIDRKTLKERYLSGRKDK